MAKHKLNVELGVWVDEATYWPEAVWEAATPPVATGAVIDRPSANALLAALIFNTLANTLGITVEEIIIKHEMTTEE